MGEVERWFTAIKLLCTCLRVILIPSKLNIFMQICICEDSLRGDFLKKVADIYRDSIVDGNEKGS